jgi:hypothetical protein
LGALALCLCAAGAAHADQQRDPELKELLQKIIGSSEECFTDKFESEVWHKAMEPRLRQFVASPEQRLSILDHVYCEAKRDPTLKLPPDLVLALIEVESRFDPSDAVLASPARSSERAGAGRAEYPHRLRDTALLLARRKSQLVAGAGALQRQRRPQHLSRAGDAALAAHLALLMPSEFRRPLQA